MFLDSHRFLEGCLDKFSTSFSSFPVLNTNGTEDVLLKRKVAYPFENHHFFEYFYEPLKLGREYNFHYFKTFISRF